ncbi:sister-chromatid cohesion protein 3 isoform X2 [Selaginella moellendorffii]|uniref:sister-chromatid cohesion protein 3 isoform X2 n=1 Tax=Selaginella moellendorffii TaxID=88036 RepID=UPI000D1C21D0|nr:sister-chromatid cohesion protein 3 isoform X2 [Selaginella moellendorffii]|eukprot:XP_024538812.1 sister-chromatid cohesion protein 3 isoform X2 [Selaginella moellendorffii]
MASSSRRRLSREELEKTRLWQEVNASSSDEEGSAQEPAQSKKRGAAARGDGLPPKRRKRQVSLESESGKDSSLEQDDRGKKRKNRQSEDSSDDRQSLIDVIKHNGKLVPRAVKNWIDRYESSQRPATCELIMCIFEACGAKYNIDEDLLDEINVDEVVLELVSQAKAGDVEDFVTSKQKDLRGFKDNLTLFWDTFVLECQNGPLFDEQLMEMCINFVTALSCTPPRHFRHVSTLIGLQLATSFVTVAKTLSQSRETKQRQLIAEEKKKRKDAARIESLNKVLSQTHDKITKIEGMIQAIIRGLFMHRYRDVDVDFRVACVKAIGGWVISYPSYFLNDLYLKYIGWTLSDKNVAVRKSSIEALRAIYEIDDNVPSMALFTQRFSNRMIELADDVDISVAVSAIGLFKQLLRHQLIKDVSPLYDLLIDESPSIRHAVGQLVYEQMIAVPNAEGEDSDKSDVQLKRLLTILKDFASDPILSDYVIDAVWEEMKAMQDWKCLISMLLDDSENQELTDVDIASLCRVLGGSAKRSVGEKLVPTIDSRKATLTKAQKEAFESSKKKLTTAMIKPHPKLLRKYLADKSKVCYIVEIMQHMNLDLYSLKQQEQSCISSLELTRDAFFKHGDRKTLQTCVNTLVFCASETKADLQDAAQRVLKETTDEVIRKLRSAIEHAGETEDDYSLTVNLRRLQHLQLAMPINNEELYKDLLTLLEDFSDLEDEAVQLDLTNIFLYVIWYLKSIDHDNPDENQLTSLITKRSTLYKHLETQMDNVISSFSDGQTKSLLSSTICTIFSDLCSLFSKEKLSSTKIERLGFSPSSERLEKFWELCELRLSVPDSDDDDMEVEREEEADYFSQKDIVITSAAKLVAHEMIPKDFIGSEIISHYVLHGKGVEETIKQLILVFKKNMKSQELCSLYLDAMKKAYSRHLEDDEEAKPKSFELCKELANRLSATFSGFARNIHRPSILKLVRNGVEHAFEDTPTQLSFLEACVLPFLQRLAAADIRDIIENVQSRVNDDDVDQDPTGWRPYQTFLEHLQERVSKTEAPGKHDQPPRPPRNAKTNNKKKLFGDESESDEEQPSESEDQIEDDDDTPLYQVRQKLKQKGPTTVLSPPSSSQHSMRTRKKATVLTGTEEDLPV